LGTDVLLQAKEMVDVDQDPKSQGYERIVPVEHQQMNQEQADGEMCYCQHMPTAIEVVHP
jgi:hypothetical protein